jgi:hypothetical protein
VMIAVAMLAPAATAFGGINREATPDGTPPVCDPVLVLMQNFDNVTPPALPSGWSSTTWVTSNSGVPTPSAHTLPNAAFVDDPATISDKQLLSPNISIGRGRLQIFFWNNFSLQEGFDGGVLEISFDNGLTFHDILAAGGTFASGGYNGTISTCCGNPLAGRQAWTGNSSGFIETELNLPIPTGPNMMLRWRMGSDSAVAGEGWRIDTVVIGQFCPTRRDRHRPRPTPAPRP